MAEQSHVIASKLANLLCRDAEMSEGVKRILPWGAKSLVDGLCGKMGGLWVGGTVTLTRQSLSFSPNGMNAAAHAGDTSSAMSLDRVAEVSDRFGWVTRIVDVRAENGEIFTFRCFGARSFAVQIRRAANQARSR